MGEFPLSQIGELMSRAKIVLCPNNGFVQGAHERILTAMGSGAVALTVPSTYLREHFFHGRHVAFFNEGKEAMELGQQILHDSQWQTVGEAGREVVASQHSWFQRGKELVSLLQQEAQEGGCSKETPVGDVAAPSQC